MKLVNDPHFIAGGPYLLGKEQKLCILDSGIHLRHLCDRGPGCTGRTSLNTNVGQTKIIQNKDV